MNEPLETGVNWRNPDGTMKVGHPPIEGAGRPKGSLSITAEIKKKLEEIPEGERKTYLEIFVNKIFKKAIDDEDVVMIKDIINRIDGMPVQKMSGDKENPISIFISKEIAQQNDINPSTSNDSE